MNVSEEMKKAKQSVKNYLAFICLVRLIGLEPTRLATPDPKSGASANFATSAEFGCKGNLFLPNCQIICLKV